MKNYSFLFRFISIFLSLSLLISCNKKKDDGAGNPQSPSGSCKDKDCHSDPKEQDPAVELPEPATATPPIVETPVDRVEDEDHFAPHNLGTNVIRQLINEVKAKHFIKITPNMSDAEERQATEQQTLNLTTAKTLKNLHLDFDSKGVPSLNIQTQEGSYDFELTQESLATATTASKNKKPSLYHLESSSFTWYNPFTWGRQPPPLFSADIEVRGKHRRVALVTLERHDGTTTSKIYIAYLKKEGQISFSYQNSQFNFEELHPDSQRLMQSLRDSNSASAYFYHVLTELEDFNTSQASQFSVQFDIYFSLTSQEIEGIHDTILLKKENVWFGNKKSPSSSKLSQAGDGVHNANAFRQGFINSLRQATYTPKIVENKVVPVIQENIIPIAIELKNYSWAKEKTQWIDLMVLF